MESKRHQARILTAYYRPKQGGLCRRYFRLIRALLAAGHSVDYVAVKAFPITHPRCTFHRLPWPEHWRTAGPVFWVWLHLACMARLLSVARTLRPTHLFSFSINYGALMQPARLITGARYSIFLRADSLRNNRYKGHGRVILALEWLVERMSLRNAHLYCVSRALLRDVRGRHRGARLASFGVLPNDVVARPAQLQAPRSPVLRVAVAGVLEPRKNVELALKVAQLCAGQGISWSIFGDGPDRRRLEDLAASLGLRECVAFLGWQDLGEAWPSIDVLVHPSVHEGAPNVVLEALGAGVMVLASDIPEHAELLGSPLLLDLNEPEAWARALRNIQADDACADAVRSAVQAAGRKLSFDWNRQAADAVLGPDFARDAAE